MLTLDARHEKDENASREGREAGARVAAETGACGDAGPTGAPRRTFARRWQGRGPSGWRPDRPLDVARAQIPATHGPRAAGELAGPVAGTCGTPCRDPERPDDAT